MVSAIEKIIEGQEKAQGKGEGPCKESEKTTVIR